MTPRNAIAILRQVETNWVANGTDHQNLIAAINILEGVVAVAEQAQGKAPNVNPGATNPDPAAASDSRPENGSEVTGEQDDSQPDTNS